MKRTSGSATRRPGFRCGARRIRRRTLAGRSSPVPGTKYVADATHIIIDLRIVGSHGLRRRPRRARCASGQAACPYCEPRGTAMSHWIDITRPMNDSILCWPGRQPPDFSWVKRLDEGHHCNVSTWALNAHTGTHIDAPLHFVEGG